MAKPIVTIEMVRAWGSCEDRFMVSSEFDGWSGDLDAICDVPNIDLFQKLWVLCRPQTLGRKNMRKLSEWVCEDLLTLAGVDEPNETPRIKRAISAYKRARTGMRQDDEKKIKENKHDLIEMRREWEGQNTVAMQRFKKEKSLTVNQRGVALRWLALSVMVQTCDEGHRKSSMDAVWSAYEGIKKAWNQTRATQFQNRVLTYIKSLPAKTD